MRKVHIMILYKNEEEKNKYLMYGDWKMFKVNTRNARDYEEIESDSFIITCKRVYGYDSLKGYKADILAVERAVYNEMIISDTDWILHLIIIPQIVPVDIQIF